MGITKIPVVLMSGFYQDYKKKNQDSIGITKNREKRLWDSIRIPKKAPKSCLGIPIFFFGILRDSSGFFGILLFFWSYLQLWGGAAWRT